MHTETYIIIYMLYSVYMFEPCIDKAYSAPYM